MVLHEAACKGIAVRTCLWPASTYGSAPRHRLNVSPAKPRLRVRAAPAKCPDTPFFALPQRFLSTQLNPPTFGLPTVDAPATQYAQRLPERIVEKAVYGMLPKGRLGKDIRLHLKVCMCWRWRVWQWAAGDGLCGGDGLGAEVMVCVCGGGDEEPTAAGVGMMVAKAAVR